MWYRVQPGDTLATIAARFGVPIEEIIRANNLRSPYILYIDQQIWIPAPPRPTPTPTPRPPSGDFERRLRRLENRVDRLENELTRLDRRVDRLERRVTPTPTPRPR